MIVDNWTDIPSLFTLVGAPSDKGGVGYDPEKEMLAMGFGVGFEKVFTKRQIHGIVAHEFGHIVLHQGSLLISEETFFPAMFQLPKDKTHAMEFEADAWAKERGYTVIASGRTELGLVPALKTSESLPASARNNPSPIWLRAELPVHRTRIFFIVI